MQILLIIFELLLLSTSRNSNSVVFASPAKSQSNSNAADDRSFEFASSSSTDKAKPAVHQRWMDNLEQPLPENMTTIEYFPSGNKQEWKRRSIYQLLTDRFSPGNDKGSKDCNNLAKYCGGTFQGIIDNLDHIEAMGFGAIWVSPVVENDADGYHGYWARDLYKINSRFGSAEDLKRLVSECHKRDIWVMVDVVANHMGSANVAGYYPFDNLEQHYHKYCLIQNYENQLEVEQCRIGGSKNSLADLNTESSSVVNKLNIWIKWLVSEFDFDGIRIDTVKHVRRDFWPGFARSAGVFAIGEILHGDARYVGPYQQVMDSVLNFPLFFTIKSVFGHEKNRMWALEKRWNEDLKPNFREPGVLGNFIDNHDFRRFMHEHRDKASIKSALVYVMMSVGIPMVYQGTEFFFAGGDDPWNREILWPHLEQMKRSTDPEQAPENLISFFKRLNRARQLAGDEFYESDQNHIWTVDRFHLFSRGRKVLVALTNVDSNGPIMSHQISIPMYHEAMFNILDPTGNTVLRPLNFRAANENSWFNWVISHPWEYMQSLISNDNRGDNTDSMIVRITLKSGEPQVFLPQSVLLPYWRELFTSEPPKVLHST